MGVHISVQRSNQYHIQSPWAYHSIIRLRFIVCVHVLHALIALHCKQLHGAAVKQWWPASVSWCDHKARRVSSTSSPLNQAAANYNTKPVIVRYVFKLSFSVCNYRCTEVLVGDWRYLAARAKKGGGPSMQIDMLVSNVTPQMWLLLTL